MIHESPWWKFERNSIIRDQFSLRGSYSDFARRFDICSSKKMEINYLSGLVDYQVIGHDL